MFKNKTVMITGGASGIGFLSGKCFAKEGANIVLVDLNNEALEKAVAEIKEITPNVIGVQADVTVYADAVKSRDKAVEAFSTVDILLPCAGGSEPRLTKDYSEFIDRDISVLDFGIDLNLKGPLYFAQVALQQMAKQNSGVIIFLGSITGQEGSSKGIAYATSKSALMTGVVKSIALAGAKYNVRACCVAPGPVLTRDAMANMKTLMGRAAETQEIVDMIMYLASDKAAFVTGTTILIDGGRNIMTNKG